MLATALAAIMALTYLAVNHNGIYCKGLEALAKALATNTALTVLALDDVNRIGIAEAAMSANTGLTGLWLGDNRMGATGAAALIAALVTSTAVSRMQSNGIGDEGPQRWPWRWRPTSVC